MKVITWNCNGAFRKKYHILDQYNADILIIQECENPGLSTKAYSQWSQDYFWIGNNKNKGLGVFAKNGTYIELLDWNDKNHLWQNETLESFLVPYLPIWNAYPNPNKPISPKSLQ